MNEAKVVMKNRARGVKERSGNMKRERGIEKWKTVMTLPSFRGSLIKRPKWKIHTGANKIRDWEEEYQIVKSDRTSQHDAVHNLPWLRRKQKLNVVSDCVWLPNRAI